MKSSPSRPKPLNLTAEKNLAVLTVKPPEYFMVSRKQLQQSSVQPPQIMLQWRFVLL